MAKGLLGCLVFATDDCDQTFERIEAAGITNVCVETTARAAAVRDLDVTVLGDCCTTYTAGHQASALDALEFYGFARVATWSGEGRAGPPTPAPAGSAEPAQR